MKYVDFKILDERARQYPQLRNGHGTDAGHDLFTLENAVVGRNTVVTDLKTGIAVCIPTGYYGRIVARSSALRKYGLFVVEGIIDAGFTGELFVAVATTHANPFVVEAGTSLAQLIIQPVPEFTFQETLEFQSTARGENGFGSTGTRA